MCAFARLEKEFACRIEKDIHVRAGNTWIRLSGAVVRGEELIAIDIHENHGDGIAYFQIKYLLEECLKLTFDRFQKCTAHLVVVSDGPEDRDAPVEAKLKKMLAEFSIDGQVRMFRLNKLRAEFSL